MLTKNLSSSFNSWLLFGLLSTGVLGFIVLNAWLGYPFFFNIDSAYSAIGGVIPFSDASAYLSGGHYFLDTGYLDSWNMRRPLNAMFFAARLNMTGGNFWYVIGLQAILCAVALTLYLKTLRQHFSFLATLLSFIYVVWYASIYLPTTLSETLGLTLGLLSFVLLWNGFQSRSRSIYCSGIAVLTLALSARAGPHFLIPAVLVFVCFYPLTNSRLKDAGWGLIACGLTFFFTLKLTTFFGSPGSTGAANANFSHTLYGLVSGGKGWHYVYDDPHMKDLIAGKSEADFARVVYAESWETFKQNPFNIVKGMIRNLGGFLYHFIRLFDTDSLLAKVVSKTIGFLFTSFVCYRVYLNRVHYPKEFSFLIILSIGILASASIIWVDGKIRPFAVAIPVIGALLCFAFAKRRPLDVKLLGKTGINSVALFLVSFIVLSAVSTRYVPSSLKVPEGALINSQQLSSQGIILTYTPRKQPYLRISDEKGLYFRTISPTQIKKCASLDLYGTLGDDFVRFINKFKYHKLVLLYVYDFVTHSNRFIAAEEHILESQEKWIIINTTPLEGGIEQISKVVRYTELVLK